MDRPEIRKDNVKPLFDTPYIHVYDLQYGEGKHYYDASRREKEDLVALRTDEEFRNLYPDAVTCILILSTPGEEPRLYLSYEYRYVTGQYLLSPPAGLLDPRDLSEQEPLLSAAKREIFEETGIRFRKEDRIFEVSRCLFCTPGMTDESNGLVCLLAAREDLSEITQTHAVGTECFDGYRLYTGSEAEKILRDGRDGEGRFFSLATWSVLMYFVSGFWKESDAPAGGRQ